MQVVLLEILIAGFFAVACIRASVARDGGRPLGWGDFLRLPGRLERLRRSRWQWFSMVALMLVLRLQNSLPPILELMALLQFIVFLALPNARHGLSPKGRGNEAAVGSR